MSKVNVHATNYLTREKIFGAANIGRLTETNLLDFATKTPVFKAADGVKYSCTADMAQRINERVAILENGSNLKLMKTIQEIRDFFHEIQKPLPFDLTDYIYHDEDFNLIDQENAFDSITDILSDNNAFDIEIIYYSEAIKYLAENDPSLSESLALASDVGYVLKNVNSEVLASLLASEKARENFASYRDTIEEFFNN